MSIRLFARGPWWQSLPWSLILLWGWLLALLVPAANVPPSGLTVAARCPVTTHRQASTPATGMGTSAAPGVVCSPTSTTAQDPPTVAPRLSRLSLVTDQAFGTEGVYVPNSWGVQKDRLIRLSTGDVFTVYISAGSGVRDRSWHLMRQAAGSTTWQEVMQGDAGTEPINIVRGPHDAIHLFTWPGTRGVLHHLESTDHGTTFTDQVIPGQWTNDQGYSGSGINALGDIVVFQSGNDVPGQFLWTYYSHITHQWQFHTTQFDVRYTYAFFFPGLHQDLTMVAERDVRREEVGYPPSSGFDYVFDAIRWFHIGDVTHPQATLSMVQAVQPTAPRTLQETDITYLTDAYLDTQDRTHILYHLLSDAPGVIHHLIIDHGQLVRAVLQSVAAANKVRIFQDAQGRFFLLSMDPSGTALTLFPGSAEDTDGTQLDHPVQVSIAALPGCTDDDFCHAPTLTLPRTGNALSDAIDGTYGNHGQEVAFHLTL